MFYYLNYLTQSMAKGQYCSKVINIGLHTQSHMLISVDDRSPNGLHKVINSLLYTVLIQENNTL